MKRSLYREPDYAFGQFMLTLRMAIGLTQAALADHLEVSRHAVGGWEAGQSYPKAEHLKAFIALGLQQHVFAVGREKEEIRALWRAAHQKVLLDESWLYELLSQQASPLMPVLSKQFPGMDSVPPTGSGPQVDWDEALDIPSFYGRQEELALLSRWVGEERCRVVSVLGMGGIGKSALSVTVMHMREHASMSDGRSRTPAPPPGIRATPTSCTSAAQECTRQMRWISRPSWGPAMSLL